MTLSNEQILNDFLLLLLDSTPIEKIQQIEVIQRMMDDREFKMGILVITNCLFARFPEMFVKVAILTEETLGLLLDTSNEGTKH